MTPSLVELEALFALLYAIFRRDQVYVVRLKTGGQPKLYPLARAVLQGLGGTYNPKLQEHIFTIDLDPVTMINASASGKNLSVDSKTVCFRALEQGSKIKAEETPDQPETPSLSGVLLVADKYEIWLGDTIIGVVLLAKNQWRARVDNKQVAICQDRITAVLAVLGAARTDARAQGLTAIKWSDAELQPLFSEPASLVATHEPDAELQPTNLSVAVEPTSSTAAAATTGVRLVEIALVIADPDVQSRAQLDMLAVSEYRTALEDGEQLPPITVFDDGMMFRVVDGFHRHAAHVALERPLINCDVRPGSKRAAILESAGSNQAHGVRRTNADKRRAIEMVLRDDDGRQWSDRKIAAHCGADGNTVGKVRSALEATATIPEQPVRKSADGKAVAASKAPKQSSGGSGLGFDREPKASSEHGSTQSKKDPRITFKEVWIRPTTYAHLGKGFDDKKPGEYVDSWQIGYMPGPSAKLEELGSIWHGMNAQILGRVDLDGFTGSKVAHDLQGRTWATAALELLGEIGIVTVDTKLEWRDTLFEPIKEPPVEFQRERKQAKAKAVSVASDAEVVLRQSSDIVYNLLDNLSNLMVELAQETTVEEIISGYAARPEDDQREDMLNFLQLIEASSATVLKLVHLTVLHLEAT